MPAAEGEPDRDRADPLIGRVLDGRYRVDRLLGAGGMGRVYEATQVELGRHVAIKVLMRELSGEPVFLERFRREAIAAAVLGSPHIVDVTDFGAPEDGPPFLVMELLSGESLMDVLRREGALDVSRAVRITVQLLDALADAHEAGIVHRDLKPENVFLVSLAGGDEMVKLLDFGVAKLRESKQAQRLTAVGALVGTPRFAAPEQLRGEEVDARTDVYGAGVVLYGMLTGRPPFPGPLEDLIRAVLEDDPPDVRVVSPAVTPTLAAVVSRAMAKAKADRFESAAAMLAALGGRARGAGAAARSRRRPRPPARAGRGGPERGARRGRSRGRREREGRPRAGPRAATERCAQAQAQVGLARLGGPVDRRPRPRRGDGLGRLPRGVGARAAPHARGRAAGRVHAGRAHAAVRRLPPRGLRLPGARARRGVPGGARHRGDAAGERADRPARGGRREHLVPRRQARRGALSSRAGGAGGRGGPRADPARRRHEAVGPDRDGLAARGRNARRPLRDLARRRAAGRRHHALGRARSALGAARPGGPAGGGQRRRPRASGRDRRAPRDRGAPRGLHVLEAGAAARDSAGPYELTLE
ncbi:MAG: serine/threonine protein kinase [Sandaracinaceae bacterium]|nr:serine/threonine protein kinase [Sandaracinaceae bacterium]